MKKKNQARLDRRAREREARKRNKATQPSPRSSTYQTPRVKILGTDPAKRREPSINPWMPEAFAPEVGKVALTFGWLESELRDVLPTLELAFGVASSPVPRLFSRMLTRYERLFEAMDARAPSLAAYLRSLFDRLKDQQWRRNFLIHGQMTPQLRVNAGAGPGAPLDLLLPVTSRRDHVWMTWFFSIADIDDVFHEPAHIWGLLRASIEWEERPPAVTEVDWALWRDTLSKYPPKFRGGPMRTGKYVAHSFIA